MARPRRPKLHVQFRVVDNSVTSMEGRVFDSLLSLEHGIVTYPRLFTFKARNNGDNIPTTPTTIMTPIPLEISPSKELQFTLSHGGTTRSLCCILTVRHPGNTTDHVAFKVGALVLMISICRCLSSLLFRSTKTKTTTTTPITTIGQN
jgi:hypothetical protein